MALLKFQHGNAKLPDSTLTFALPAGYTCPGALHCHAFATRQSDSSRKHGWRYSVHDGPYTLFRCYAASEETYHNVYEARWHNWTLLRHLSSEEAARLLCRSLEAHRNHKSERVRWFTSGDCPNVAIRDALIATAQALPELRFYLYSKHLPLWLDGGRLLPLPSNLKLTASWGGRWDFLLSDGVFPRTARVVNTQEEAYALNLPLDFNDQFAHCDQDQHFAHLVHGTQPAGSAAGAALAARRKAGLFTGYSNRKPSHGNQLPPHAPAGNQA